MKCQPTKVPLLLYLCLYASPQGLQLVADITGGVIPGRAQPKLSGPRWPSVTLGFDDRLGLLCSGALSR